MRKIIFLGFLTLAIAVLINCGGMPEESSSSESTSSFIFNNAFQSIVYEGIGNQTTGLIGDWRAEDNSRNLYSVIDFDENNNFVEKVQSKLTHETIAYYEGKFSVNSDVLKIVANDGSVFSFAFNINANSLQLLAK